MADRYYATISGNDVSSAASWDVGDDLDAAKTKADELLGDGFQHHTIVIYDRKAPMECVAQREISAEEWVDV